MGRANPNPDVFPAPNRGINLGNIGVPHSFNYYADVFYGTDYETELDSYYEAGDELEQLGTGRLGQLEAGLNLPQPVTLRQGMPLSHHAREHGISRYTLCAAHRQWRRQGEVTSKRSRRQACARPDASPFVAVCIAGSGPACLVFGNRRHDKIKLPGWQKNGFWLCF